MHAAVLSEKRVDAVEGRSLVVALPEELDIATCLELLVQLANHLAQKFRVASVFALHAPDAAGDPRNKHGHLIWTSRKVQSDGCSLGKKTREWDTREGNQHTEDLRAWWCGRLNATLKEKGYEPNIEHKSFARLGIHREPTQHAGVAQVAMVRREYLKDIDAQYEGERPHLRPLPEPKPAPQVQPRPLSEPQLVPPTQFRKLPQPESAAVRTVPSLRPLPTPRATGEPALGKVFRPLPEPDQSAVSPTGPVPGG